jgi:hypothetical protein
MESAVDDVHRADDGVSIPFAVAGLSLFESIMLVLVEKGLVSDADLHEAMQGAIDSHMNARPTYLSATEHQAAAEVIKRIMKGANSVRATAHL